MSPLQVSVVIPTYRRPDLIKRCLDAVCDQDIPAASYEVIVADDEASERTRQVVEMRTPDTREGAHESPEIRYVAVTGAHGPAAARNRGWQAATAPIVAFTDDDCLPTQSWLRQGLSRIDAGADAVQGRIEVPIRHCPTDYELDASHLAEAEFATANAFIRRDALEDIDGFDERFTAAWREDSDLFFALIERGKRVVRSDAAVVVHPVRRASWGISVKQQRKSLFNALLYKKHPRLYRERIQASPPWGYYRILAALLLGLVSAGSGRKRFAVAAGAAWAALTARFALTRLRNTSHAPSHLVEMAVTSAFIPPLSLYWRLRGAVKYRVAFL